MKDLIIVGHSGFAQEIKWLVDRINAEEKKWKFIGYIDQVSDDEVIGNDEYVLKIRKDTDVVIAIADGRIRKKLYKMYAQNKNLMFPSIIDPSVIYEESIQMGIGNIICAGNILTVSVSLGDFNIINLDCTVGHEATIEDFITMNPSVNVSGNALIEEGVCIGTGAQVLQGIKIGKNSIVGAGAVVTKNLPEACTAVGVPAKVIK